MLLSWHVAPTHQNQTQNRKQNYGRFQWTP